MTEQVEQWSLHKILCKVWIFLYGNYSDDSGGRSYGQLVIDSFTMTAYLLMHHISCKVFGETSNHPGDLAPLPTRFGTLHLLGFPKTKITFEREEISDHRWDSGKHSGTDDGDWENCVRSQVTYFEGDWGVIVLCTMFLVYLLSSSRNVFIFGSTCLDTFWTDLV